ncbi:MAG TPA: hypothetical protein DCL61_31865 [Cyanobacteria bacterium UBA12227]|nr:hypothetical protein [Cyanobacteria bacterium UBA12227]HAX89888.1 hypothetical protein [Cyanobacteria bacterium UBA11370]
MSGLFDILRKIKTRPGMYIGRPSLSDLFMFLVGYKTARRELGIEPSEQEVEFYREFQPWIQKRFNVQTVNSWAKIILLYSVDEKEAFTYFFKLLDEFLVRDNNLAVNQGDESQRGVEVSPSIPN